MNNILNVDVLVVYNHL